MLTRIKIFCVTMRLKTCVNFFCALSWLSALVYYYLGYRIPYYSELKHTPVSDSVSEYRGFIQQIGIELPIQRVSNASVLSLVFVTAAKSAEINSIVDLLRTVQHQFPKNKIAVYDLDLSNDDLETVSVGQLYLSYNGRRGLYSNNNKLCLR